MLDVQLFHSCEINTLCPGVWLPSTLPFYMLKQFVTSVINRFYTLYKNFTRKILPTSPLAQKIWFPKHCSVHTTQSTLTLSVNPWGCQLVREESLQRLPFTVQKHKSKVVFYCTYFCVVLLLSHSVSALTALPLLTFFFFFPLCARTRFEEVSPDTAEQFISSLETGRLL